MIHPNGILWVAVLALTLAGCQRDAVRPGIERAQAKQKVSATAGGIFMPAQPQASQESPRTAPPRASEPPPTARPALVQPGQNVFYDEANPDYSRLQKANEALAGFPLDKNGYVDWMAALSRGLIAPREERRGQGRMQVLDQDVVMRRTREMPYVLFPHKAHTLWLDCSNCHPAPFEAKAGSHQITMADIFRGKYCGTCHDRVAFLTYFACERCHRIPHEGSPGWWNQ